MMELSFVLFAILIAMYVSYRWMRRKHSLLDSYDVAMNEFIKASDALLSDSDTPPSIIDLIKFMRERAADPESARSFLMHILVRRKEISRTPRIADIERMERTRPELARTLSLACSSAFLAISYNSELSGVVLRKLVLFDAKERTERSKELAESYREIEKSPHHDGLVPA